MSHESLSLQVYVIFVTLNPTDKLRWERDVWEGAAYGLAGQVSEMKQLRTLRRLQLGEKAWAMLVRHFTILLSDKDTQQLSEVDRYVGEWREGVMSVSGRLREMERDMRNRVRRRGEREGGRGCS